MALDADDLKKIGEIIAAANAEAAKTAVNADAVGKMIKQALADNTTAIDAKIKEVADKVKPGDTETETAAEKAKREKDGKFKAKDGEVDPAIARLEQQLADLTKANKASAEKAEKAELAKAKSEEQSAIRDALSANGVPAERQRLALLALEADGRVKRDASGKIIYSAPRKGYEDPLDLGDGIKEYLATDEGKQFVPPLGTGGTGTGAGGNGGQRAGSVKPADLIISF